MHPARVPLTHIDDSTPPSALGARGSVVVVGNFDGVHRGHQAVLEEAVDDAHAEGLRPVVLTFDPHPSGVLGRGAPPLLTTMARRAELMVRLGIDEIFVRRFDRAFAAWPPERFVSDLLAAVLCARIVVVGENFRFGAGRSGDLTLLRELGATRGFRALSHAIARDERDVFSSTRAREAVAAGRLDEAQQVLGRRHSFAGVVVHGDKRGRTIGFPTVNLSGIAELVPPRGVYSVLVDESAGYRSQEGEERDRPLAGGVMNIGVRPTAGGELAQSVEAHLFDTSRDLYGVELRVHLVSRLRDEKKFDSFDDLRAQIQIDSAEARAEIEPLVAQARTRTDEPFG